MLQVENEVIERLVARIKKEEIPRYGSWHNFAAQSRFLAEGKAIVATATGQCISVMQHY